MKRRLDGEAELKCETGPAADDAASEGDVAQLVAALVAKELLAGLSGARARFGGVAFGGAQEAAVGDFLRQKLGKESLTRRPGPGGKRLTYIESCKAIELANRAFGFNGWSCRILECKEEYKEKRGDRWTIGFSSVVRIELKDGTSHEDVGFGTSDGQRDLGAAIEQAKKASISDARKRALRLFGEYLGNSCYDREHIKEVTSARAPPGPAPLPAPSGVGLASPANLVGQVQSATAHVQQVPPQHQHQHQQAPHLQPSLQPQLQQALQQPLINQAQEMQRPPQQQQYQHQQQQNGQRLVPQQPVTSTGASSSYEPTSHSVTMNVQATNPASTVASAASAASRISSMHTQQQQQQQQRQQMHYQQAQANRGSNAYPNPAQQQQPSPARPSPTRQQLPPRQPLRPFNQPPLQTRLNSSTTVEMSPFKLENLGRPREAVPTSGNGTTAAYEVEDLSYSQFDFDPDSGAGNPDAKRMRT